MACCCSHLAWAEGSIMMKHAHDPIHTDHDVEMDAIAYPPSGHWDGQVIDLNPGAF